MGDAGEVLEVLLNDESAGGSPERAVSGKQLKLKEKEIIEKLKSL